jgi:hypothetical protein
VVSPLCFLYPAVEEREEWGEEEKWEAEEDGRASPTRRPAGVEDAEAGAGRVVEKAVQE